MSEPVWKIVRDITQPRERLRGLTGQAREAASRLSVEQIAEVLRVDPVTVYKWGEAESGRKFPAELVGPLKKTFDDTTLIQKLCQDCDGYYYPRPTRSVAPADLAKLAREFADVLDACSDPNKRTQIEKEANDLIIATLGVVAHMEQQCADSTDEVRM